MGPYGPLAGSGRGVGPGVMSRGCQGEGAGSARSTLAWPFEGLWVEQTDLVGMGDTQQLLAKQVEVWVNAL